MKFNTFTNILTKKFARVLTLIFVSGALLFLYTNCSGGNSIVTGAQSNNSIQVFSNSVSEFKIAAIYESGATPYVGALDLALHDTWDIAHQSFSALFLNHSSRTITVPRTTTQMVLIGSQGVSNWSQSDLISLGQTYSSALISGTTVTVTVIFLRGYYQGSSNILGANFAGYPFVFVFKDAVSLLGGSTTQQRYIEQATVVHQIGHAIGLVNNGVAMVANHEDTAHPTHSTNSQCVMYWPIESSTTIVNSLSNAILTSRLNLFGSQTLADGRALHN